MTDILDQMSISVNQPPQGDILDDMGIAVPTVEQRNDAALKNVVDLNNPKNENEAAVVADFDENNQQITALAKMYHTPEQIDWFKKNPMGITETFNKALDQSDITPAGSFYSGAEAIKIADIAKRMGAGEQVSEAEKKQADEYFAIYTERALRGSTIGGSIAQTLAQMPAFAFEFVATAGVGKLAQTATVKAAEKVAVKSAVAGAIKAGTAKTAGVAANISSRVALTGLPVEGYGERRINNYMTITDKGEMIFRNAKESPLKSALMAYGYSSIEFGSEMAGASMTKYLVSPASAALKTPLVAAINKLPVDIRNNIYRAYKTIQPNAQVSKVMTAAGWNGMLEELGEERLAQVLNATLGVAGGDVEGFDGWLDAITPTKDQLLIEAGAITIAGSARKSADMAFNILKTKGVEPAVAKEITDNMSANEQEQFVESNLVKPESGYEAVKPFIPYIETSEFKARFSDTVAPEARTESGSPKQFFHGTANTEFTQFNTRPEPSAVSSPRQVLGSFFTENPEQASGFAYDYQNISPDGGNVRVVYLSPQKLYTLTRQEQADINSIGDKDLQIEKFLKLREKLEGDGFDGVKLESLGGEGESIAIFYPDKIIPAFGEQQADLADGLPTASNPILEASAQQMQKAQEAEPPPIIDSESNFNQFYRLWVNQLDPIQDLETMARDVGAQIKAGESPKLLSRMYASVITRVQSQLQVATDYIDESGNRVVTGKALKSIMDDFDNMFIVNEPNRKAREKDFSDYLVATRYLEDLSSKKDVLVTDAQKAESVAALARLEKKYGENLEFFKTFAREIYEFQQRILENLVRSKTMSKEQFDKIIAENPNYIPFQRVMEDESFGALTSGGIFTNANSKKVVKKIHGSEKEIKNVFESIIKNTARIMDYAERNKVAGSVAAMASYLPEYVQKTPAPIVKKGTAQIKVSYDKKLREKLQATIEALGGTLERKKSLKVKGHKNVLGSYSPSEKAVRLKIGTTEGTMTHEVGHMLDYVFGLKEKLLATPKMQKELKELAKQRLSAEIELGKEGADYRFKETIAEVGDQKYMDYILNNDEVIANFFDAYINSPKLAKEVAPTALKAFEKLIKETPEMAFIQDIKPSTERGEETIEQDVYGESPFVPPNTIVYFNEGKKEYYRVAKPIYEAMTQLTPSQLSLLEKIFMLPASILRMGATLTPEFMARSIIREGHTAMVLSGVKFNPARWVEGLFGVIGQAAGGKSDLYKEWQASGGKFNFYMELNDKGLEKAYKEILRPQGQFASYIKNPLKVLEKTGMAVDEITRVGIYSAAKKQGYSDMEAAFISRDIYDYSRRGTSGKQINRYVPFFNAAIQGADKFARAFKENPKAATFWSVATITLPSMLLAGYYLYGADDDERQEYLEHPEAIRNLFWLYKEDGEWKKIPKPFTVGYLFGTIPEKMMIWMYEGDKPEGKALWQQLLLGTAGAVSPVYDPTSLIPTAARIPLESLTNYNFFYGRSIYPDWMDRLPPEERSNKFTSETAKAFGEQFGLSPALIDNAIRGQFGGSGKYATDAGDYILNSIKEANGQTVPEKPETDSDVMLLRAFAQRRPAGYRSNSAGNFFDKWGELQQKHAAYGRKEGKEKAEYMRDNAKELSLYKPMKSYYEQMRGLQKEVDAIYAHKTMPAEQKVERINALEDRITDVARQGNKYYNRIIED